MPRDNDGVFTPLRDWEVDAANGVPFDPERWNAQDQDFANALNDLPMADKVPTYVPPGTPAADVRPGSIMYEDGIVYIRIGQPVWVDVSSIGLSDVNSIVNDVLEAVASDESLFHDTALTGTPTAPTAAPSTNTTQLATTEFVADGLAGKSDVGHNHDSAYTSPSDVTTIVSNAVNSLVNAAPGALDTLDELAAALGNDANFSVTITNALAGKAATTHTHAISDVTGLQSAIDGKAASSHSHAISDVTGLQSALDGKAASSHTHAVAQISDASANGRSLISAADYAAMKTLLAIAASNITDSGATGRSLLQSANAATATALLNTVVGDSGSGGTKGLVPAPAAGDAAAGKFLHADGTYKAPSSGSLEFASEAEAQAGSATDKPLNALRTRQAIDARVPQAGLVAAGIIVMWPGTSAPSGYLKCNGAAVSRSTYATLFAAIGTSFGVGDGSTTFNVPELRGEFVRGLDDGRSVDTGRTLGSAQSDEVKSHTHTASTSVNVSHNAKTTTAAAGLDMEKYGSGLTDASVTATATTTVNSTGGTETRPRNIALLYCIKH